MSTPSENKEKRLTSLREIRKVMQRQEQRSRATHCSDSPGPPNSLIDIALKPLSLTTKKTKKPPEIDTNILQGSGSKAASVRSNESAKSFDIRDLLLNQDNEYSKALRRIEALKRSTLIESHHVRSVASHTEAEHERLFEKAKNRTLVPQSVPAKDRQAFFAEKERVCKSPNLKSDFEEPKEDYDLVENEKVDADPLFDAEGGEEISEKEQLILMSKEIRDIKRNNVREEDEWRKEIENIKIANEEEINKLQEKHRAKLNESIIQENALKEELAKAKTALEEAKANTTALINEEEIAQLTKDHQSRMDAAKKEIEALKQQIVVLNSQLKNQEETMEDEQNGSKILEESTVNIKKIHTTEGLFLRKPTITLNDKLRSLIEKVSNFLEDEKDRDCEIDTE